VALLELRNLIDGPRMKTAVPVLFRPLNDFHGVLCDSLDVTLRPHGPIEHPTDRLEPRACSLGQSFLAITKRAIACGVSAASGASPKVFARVGARAASPDQAPKNPLTRSTSRRATDTFGPLPPAEQTSVWSSQCGKLRMLVLAAGKQPLIVERMLYFEDLMFKGMFDA